MQNAHDYIAPESWVASEDAKCLACGKIFGHRTSLMSHLSGRDSYSRCFREIVLSGRVQLSRESLIQIRAREAKDVAQNKSRGRAARATAQVVCLIATLERWYRPTTSKHCHVFAANDLGFW